ncbi:hypothetical protein N7G274_006623 [Stereocaulon virgatum]|uniref:DNA topoisomerase (ATP-hydrolyzing) n=1 Tax=Stereocaulon virgatum TaxID=373712 RepID=A0ABR4A585_9LECA
MTSVGRHANVEVITKIEKIFENIADSLLRQEELSIPLRYKKLQPMTPHEATAELSSELTNVSFPAKTPREARSFTVLIRILGLMHEALCDDVMVSKRNIYYKDPALFKTQAVVDRYVDILAYTFGVQRSALNVTAAAKGLVAGELTLTNVNGTTVRRGGESPHLIDDVSEVQKVDLAGVNWVIIIEKESTFRTLASSLLHQNSRAGKGIILTAKGYPDISTRAFLRLLSTTPTLPLQLPPPPIYALTDFDPDGIAIMSNYKHGSYTLSHENEHLNVPGIRWLGIKSRDIVNEAKGTEARGSLKLSGRDRKKAVKMLENSLVLQEGGGNGDIRRDAGWRGGVGGG